MTRLVSLYRRQTVTGHSIVKCLGFDSVTLSGKVEVLQSKGSSGTGVFRSQSSIHGRTWVCSCWTLLPQYPGPLLRTLPLRRSPEDLLPQNIFRTYTCRLPRPRGPTLLSCPFPHGDDRPSKGREEPRRTVRTSPGVDTIISSVEGFPPLPQTPGVFPPPSRPDDPLD